MVTNEKGNNMKRHFKNYQLILYLNRSIKGSYKVSWNMNP